MIGEGFQRAVEFMEALRKQPPAGPDCRWCGVSEMVGPHPANPNWHGRALHAFEAGVT